MTLEWKSDGKWLELFVDGKLFGCIREGTKRKGDFFVSEYGGSTVTKNSQPVAMGHLEKLAAQKKGKK